MCLHTPYKVDPLLLLLLLLLLAIWEIFSNLTTVGIKRKDQRHQ